MTFVANLRSETIEAFAAQEASLAAYLLSSHRVSPAALEQARLVRDANLPLFADNGTKPLIDQVIDKFQHDAKVISAQIREIRHELGHVPRGQEIPAILCQRANELAAEVVEHATQVSEAVDTEQLLAAQLSMAPTDLIAQEDFATACLIALNLERETTHWPIPRIDSRNRRSLRLWRRIAEDARCQGIRVYAVLSAMDYNTARSAGRLAARAGVTHAAIGMAGVASDSSAVDFFVVHTASFSLDKPAPRRYIRLAQLLRGITNGYAEAGGDLHRFHCLGLGAPFMMPVLAAALDDTTAITTDATSPIHDAVRDHVFYDPEHAGDRASTREIVVRIVNGGNWPFMSPFTQAFRDQFGHDPESARRWFASLDQPHITKAHLRTPSILTQALPLFCEAEPDTSRVASKTRIAHNHWFLNRLTRELGSTAERRDKALLAIHDLVASKKTITTRGLVGALSVFAETNPRRR
ncbi:hypothetical protein N6L25_13360 [Marinobacter sp. SS21]|nr:hypothetical protein [Marinobacter sp. SS21]